MLLIILYLFPKVKNVGGDAICINVDEFSEDWNCKYNVNKQVFLMFF